MVVLINQAQSDTSKGALEEIILKIKEPYLLIRSTSRGYYVKKIASLERVRDPGKLIK